MRPTHLALLVAASTALTACSTTPDREATAERSSAVDREEIQEVILRVGVLAEDSLYSCIMNGIVQGLPLAQVQEECATKLLADDQKGFGGALGDIAPANQAFFDPKQVSVACNSGDSTLGKEPPGSAQYGHYGTYSWGGKETNTEYALTETDSLDKKMALVEAAEAEAAKALALHKAYVIALDKKLDAMASGDKAAIEIATFEAEQAETAANKQADKADAAHKKATEDPNKKPFLNAKQAPGMSACESALAGAREILRECQRTNWKNYQCQKLLADMNGCADPALILVDPEQGYSCGETPDPEAVKDAVVARCEERAKYGPEGPNPCQPPSLNVSSRFMTTPFGDICDNPAALRDPDSEACMGTFYSGKNFGEVDIDVILVVAMEKIGGPLVVIQPPKPPPGPAPGPK